MQAPRRPFGSRARAPARPGAPFVLAVMLWAAALASDAQAQIYGSADSNGTLVLTNHAQGDGDVVLVEAPPAPPPPPALAEAPRPPPAAADPEGAAKAPALLAVPYAVAGIIRDAARLHSLPEALLQAMVAVESGFDGRAVSRKGAKGLMQLMPDTARRFGVKDVFAPDQNVRAGAAYMRILMDQFAGDMPLALAAYNAGEGAVMRAGRRVPPYPETQHYVRKVLARVALSNPSASLPER